MLRGTPGWRVMKPARSRVSHLVDGGRCHTEVSADIGFGRWPSMHPRVGVDEGQILALLKLGLSLPDI
jgi:hypothetical protein